ncbi:MAG: CRISPR-associated endonuclease Cas2 [Burkholderiales bacterium]|jgi:CRISPR-associated protein Cas2
MSLHEITGWIVCYDIKDSKRLQRVHRQMIKWGVPLQYSVFLVQASSAQLHRLMLTLEGQIDTSADDVRAYRIPVQAECHIIGPSILPEDILISAAPPSSPLRHRVRVEKVLT